MNNSHDYRERFPQKSDDELYQEALKFLKTIEQSEGRLTPSVSLFQRMLRIGYGSSARIVERLEEEGYISKFIGGKPRKVLKTN